MRPTKVVTWLRDRICVKFKIEKLFEVILQSAAAPCGLQETRIKPTSPSPLLRGDIHSNILTIHNQQKQQQQQQQQQEQPQQ